MTQGNHGGTREGAGRPVQGSKDAQISEQYRVARAVRETQRARMAELQLKKMEGTLCDVDGVRRAAYAMGQYLQRNLVDVLPSTLAVELAAITDAAELERTLRDRLRTELQHLAATKVDEMIQQLGGM